MSRERNLKKVVKRGGEKGKKNSEPWEQGTELQVLEVAIGFEPMHDGFANHCLTTWLRHRLEMKILVNYPA